MIYFDVFQRPNNMAKFLEDKEIYIIEEGKYHIVYTQWVKIRIFMTYRINFGRAVSPVFYHWFMIACSKFCHLASVICVFYKVQVMRFLVVLFEKRVKF